jgi:hypothetical protein
MNSRSTPHWAACWTLILGFVCLALSTPASAQGEKPEQVVEERDLGDGFSAVSVNGGPPAIVDNQTGLIFKQFYGRPAVVDQEAGAILYLDKQGEPALKFYGDKGGAKGAPKQLDPKRLERMKAYMQRVKAHTKTKGLVGAKGKPKPGKKSKLKKAANRLEERLALYLQLLGVAGGESEVIVKPRLEAVLRQQDQIRRSTLDVIRVKTPKGPGGLRATTHKTQDLPSAIQDFLRAFRAHVSGKASDQSLLCQGLASYRAARGKQDAALKSQRAKLREVLTPTQEALLVALSVLD